MPLDCRVDAVAAPAAGTVVDEDILRHVGRLGAQEQGVGLEQVDALRGGLLVRALVKKLKGAVTAFQPVLLCMLNEVGGC